MNPMYNVAEDTMQDIKITRFTEMLFHIGQYKKCIENSFKDFCNCHRG